ncbi:hypothetical protein C9994_00020 [Marivirga lumbricoides]|uniref:Uncharacterized protein n=1 Tax=Marivirga lumbricoides TaxID=1046115 RepID=A0A2T4DVZ5_9BACT|nr:hypothetical protein C9994_00020 [Marivirga lumbricoides]
MKIIEKLKSMGFEETDKEISPLSLIKGNCVIVFNDWAVVKYNGRRHLFQEFGQLISFLEEEKIV